MDPAPQFPFQPDPTPPDPTPPASPDPGYVPRLLTAAAFLTRRATDASFAELRLTQERASVLRALGRAPVTAEAAAARTGLPPEHVHDCLRVLLCGGYAETAGHDGGWTITAAGEQLRAQADDAESRLMAPGHDAEALRVELLSLITALTPPSGTAPRPGASPAVR